MSFGSDTAATADMSVGYSADVPGGASGYTGAGGAVPGTGDSGIVPGGGASAQGPSLMSKFTDLLKDPEVQKALGEAAKHLGNMNTSLNKLSPDARKILQQVIAGGRGGGVGGRPSSGVGAIGTKPYMGDMPQFSAEHAQDTLKSLGIPF